MGLEGDSARPRETQIGFVSAHTAAAGLTTLAPQLPRARWPIISQACRLFADTSVLSAHCHGRLGAALPMAAPFLPPGLLEPEFLIAAVTVECCARREQRPSA